MRIMSARRHSLALATVATFAVLAYLRRRPHPGAVAPVAPDPDPFCDAEAKALDEHLEQLLREAFRRWEKEDHQILWGPQRPVVGPYVTLYDWFPTFPQSYIGDPRTGQNPTITCGTAAVTGATFNQHARPACHIEPGAESPLCPIPPGLCPCPPTDTALDNLPTMAGA